MNEEISNTNLLKCCRCQQYKPKTDFYIRSDKKRGYHYKCKKCEKAYAATPHAKALLKKRCKKYNDKLRDENPKKYYKRSRQSRLYRYGLTENDYQDLLKKQNGVCAICGRESNGRKSKFDDTIKLHVDHDHATGKVRGLLCTKCNMAIGGFDENISIIKKAIQYLEENQ